MEAFGYLVGLTEEEARAKLEPHDFTLLVITLDGKAVTGPRAGFRIDRIHVHIEDGVVTSLVGIG